MCRLFVVVKLVLLKLLLASISGLTSLSAYEYGYHPSAEEFDGLLRDTHTTWTHNILNKQTQRELYKKSPPTTEVRSYVPKFQYESNLQTFKPNQKRHDLQEYTSASNSNTNTKGTIQNLSSTLDFHYVNDDAAYNTTHSLSGYDKPKETNVHGATSNSLPEINLKPLTKPEIEKYSLNNIYKNNSHAHFPIYFTNPATGIVYAITEMGKSSENLTRTNGSIPIFITKEQYERDILLLKQEYEHKCGLDDKTTKKTQIVRPSSFSRSTTTTTTTSTTIRPQIIRLQKPFSSAQSSMKFATPLRKPSSVVVSKEITVKDHKPSTPRPLRKKRKQKNKKKTKKTKPPGHQTGPLTTPRPNSLVLAATSGVGPTIVKGTRTTTKMPYNYSYKHPTQLEKPNFGTTIFSTGALPATSSNEAWNSHLHFNSRERSKRSTDSKNLNGLDKNFKNGVIRKPIQSEYKSDDRLNTNLKFESKWSKQNSNFDIWERNIRSTNFKNTHQSQNKFKKFISDDQPKNKKDIVLKSQNILVNLNPIQQNVDKNKFKIKNSSMGPQNRGISDMKFKENFLKSVERVNFISDSKSNSDYSADNKLKSDRKSTSRQTADKFNEDFKEKLEMFSISVLGVKSLLGSENRIKGEIKKGYFDNNNLKSKKHSIDKINKSIKDSKESLNVQYSYFPINRILNTEYGLKALNSEESQNAKNFKTSKGYLQNYSMRVSKSTTEKTISDKLDFDNENSNKNNREYSKNIAEKISKIQRTTKKIFPKKRDKSEVIIVLNEYSNLINLKPKHHNNMPDKNNPNKNPIELIIIDKKLSSNNETQFKKDLTTTKQKLNKHKFKMIKYPSKKEEIIKSTSEKFKGIAGKVSIPIKIQFKKGLKTNDVVSVKSDTETDKYSNLFYRINDKSNISDTTKATTIEQISIEPITKDFMTTEQIVVKSEYPKEFKVIKLSHDILKSTDKSSKQIELDRFRKPSIKNKLHNIRKRSVKDPKRNVTAPKFVKKSYNSTQGNFPVIDSTTANTTTGATLENKTETSIELQRSVSNNLNSKRSNSKNSTSAQKSSSVKKRKRNRPRKKFHKPRNRTKTLKKRKRIQIQTIKGNMVQNDTSHTISTNTETSTPRNINEAVTKMVTKFLDNKRAKNSPERLEEEYDFYDIEENDVVDKDDEEEEDDDDGDDDDDDGDDDDGDDSEEDDEDDLKEVPIHDNGSSAEDGADFGAMGEEEVTTPEDKINPTTEYKESETETNVPEEDVKKRIRRRPTPLTKSEDDYDEDDEEDSSMGSNLGGFFRMIFYPVQIVMSSIMDTFLGGKEPEEQSVNPYTQYTSYHNTLKQHSSDDYSYDDDEDYDDSSESSLGGWLSSWFGLNRRNKKISSTTVAPLAAQRRPTQQSNNWFQSWFGIGGNDGIDKTDTIPTEDYDDYDKWFASWFGEIKPKARKRTTTTTTSTTTQLPHVPILTIVDPMRNPQNWIGILAHHIINQTSTTTQNPLRDIWTRMTTPEATTTTTENPEIPRKISYNKYQIWRLKPQDDSQVVALEEYKKGDDGVKLQWLKGPSLRGLTDVLVPPRMLVDFQTSLSFESIDHEVLIFDVGKAIAYEKSKEDYFFTTTQKPKKKHHNRYANKPPTAMTWMRYYEFDDIVTFMESMRLRYPQLVELIHIGRSYEGRPLIVMKIESKEAAATNSAQYMTHDKAKLRHKNRIGLANAVFIEGGTHGMEWIAPATATWIINELLKVMKTNKTSSDEANLIRNTTWFIMPVLNPDGYVYSHEYDRFWKKSRSRHISRPSGLINSAMTWLQKKKTKDRVCFGVDLDRNWNYQWGKRGSSKSPCNEFFAGPGPFSEPETKALSEFLMDYRTYIKLYISMQAYGQIISYPYKANTTYDTERLDDFLDVAMVGTDGLRKKGSKSRYKIDSTNDLVENRSGCSDAFVAYDVGIPFSYTLQLADNGVHGYLLPSSSIESTSKDAFEIITAMLDYI